MAILSDKTLDFPSNSLDQTMRFGVRLGEMLQPRDVICLYGQLGAGKTAFVRGVGRGWGSAIRVTSPTYTLINEYPRSKDGVLLYHLDFYRLSSSAEIITTGLEDIFDKDAAFIIEWPDRIEDYLPQERLNLTMKFNSDTRRDIIIEAIGKRPEAMLKMYRKRAFGV